MRLLTVALLAALLMGCGQSTPETAGTASYPTFICAEGFLYVKVGHGMAPVFDKADRLPRRCPN